MATTTRKGLGPLCSWRSGVRGLIRWSQMAIWLETRNENSPEGQFEAYLAKLSADEMEFEVRRNEVFHFIVGCDDHKYTLTWGAGIPRQSITRVEVSVASSSQAKRCNEDLLQTLRAEMDEREALLRAEIERHLSQSQSHPSSPQDLNEDGWPSCTRKGWFLSG